MVVGGFSSGGRLKAAADDDVVTWIKLQINNQYSSFHSVSFPAYIALITLIYRSDNLSFIMLHDPASRHNIRTLIVFFLIPNKALQKFFTLL